MKICIATTIFGPNEILIDKNLNSLKSLLNLKNINVDFYFAGWINDKSKWKNFDEIIKKFNPKKYVKYNRNYGKAYDN